MVNQIQFTTKEEKKSHLNSLIRIPSINPRPYNQDDEYARLDFILHPQYGAGFVEEIVGDNQVRVFFEEGERTVFQKKYLIRN
jgi:hypothetical protein